MREKQELGKIISSARKVKKITQQEFANMLNVSDKAISNWETGKNYPDLVILNDICNILGLNISELLIDREKNMSLSKKILVLFVFLILIILFVFLFLYFVNNYNKFNVYEIELESEKYELSSSYLIINNSRILFNMGSLSLSEEENINPQFYVKLYQESNGKKKDIIGKNKYKGITLFYDYIEDNNKDYSNFTNKLNDLYMEVNYKDKNNELVQESIKIKFKKIISNDKILYSKLSDDISIYDESQLILLKNNGYVKSDNNIYAKYKIDDINELYYIYDINNQIFCLEKENDKLKYISKYDIEEEIIIFKLINEKGNIIEEFNYDINSEEIECIIGKCSNINIYIEEVLSEHMHINNN